MIIRKSRVSDARQLMKFYRKTPQLQINEEQFYTTEFVSGVLKDKNWLTLVAEEGREIMGFLSAEISKDAKYSYMDIIYTSPSFRRKGIASKLFKKYESYCRKLHLQRIVALVQTTNKKSINWFRKHHVKTGKKMYYLEKRLR